MQYSDNSFNNLCNKCGCCNDTSIEDFSKNDQNESYLDHKDFPHSCWDALPYGCGYEGWQFEQREHYKKFVRELKETLYELTFLDDDFILRDSKSVAELRTEILDKISPYQKYGADNW